MTKWRVATAFLILAMMLQLAVIYLTKDWQSANLGYAGYLPYWPKWYAVALSVLIMALGPVLAWSCSPLLRGLVAYELRMIKLWGANCVLVRMDQEARALNMVPGKYRAKKVAKYRGPERRKRA